MPVVAAMGGGNERQGRRSRASTGGGFRAPAIRAYKSKPHFPISSAVSDEAWDSFREQPSKTKSRESVTQCPTLTPNRWTKPTAQEHVDNWVHNTGETESSRRDWILRETREKCAEEKENFARYKDLFGFLFFTALYLAILVTQRHSTASFEISKLLYEYLPEYTNSGDIVQPFQSWDTVLTYLDDKIIKRIWQDSTCGDGSCVAPFEYISWGHPDNLHGCQADCGSILELTNVTVYLDYRSVTQNGLLAEKLSQEGAGYAAAQAVSWNVCTSRPNKLVEECWYAEPPTVSPPDFQNGTILRIKPPISPRKRDRGAFVPKWNISPPKRSLIKCVSDRSLFRRRDRDPKQIPFWNKNHPISVGHEYSPESEIGDPFFGGEKFRFGNPAD